MKIAVAADHEGYLLRREVVDALHKDGHDVLDLGVDSPEPVDYPDSARAVATAVRDGSAERGILICGSGAGVCVAAGKFPGILAATAHDTFTAHQAVEHDDVNVLCMGSNVVGKWLALDIVRAFVGARFSGVERHRRRVGKVREIEREFLKEV